MAILTAPSDDPSGLRRIFAELRQHVEVLGGSPVLSDSLARVVWELLTNVQHAGTVGVVVVDVEPRRIVVRLPGPPFDSVARAAAPRARGLETAAWRLGLNAWRWSHRYVAEKNEVVLESTEVDR